MLKLHTPQHKRLLSRDLRTVAFETKVTRQDGQYGVKIFRERIPSHAVEGTVEVWVDAEDILMRLAARALRARNGRAVYMKGAVVVKVAGQRMHDAVTERDKVIL